jgi:3-hydroxyisobutyrate dehydrogenase-like beta-hydroxyacid dehydrogenase
MGSAVGHVLAQTGARVVATLDGRSERTAALASRAPLELVPDLATLVEAADVILSIVPPGEAERVAADVARAGEAADVRPLLVELNAIAPQRVRRISGLNAHSLDVVDGSISGPPPWKAGTTRIYLSGPRAPDVVALGFPGVELVVVGDELGLASAVKMCTASVYKGTAALLTHALVTARANGVLEHVLDDLGSSWPVFVEGAERWIAGSATKAARYVAEMEEIAATQGAAGVSPALFEGLADAYRALSKRPLAQRAPEDVDGAITLDEALAGLSDPA